MVMQLSEKYTISLNKELLKKMKRIREIQGIPVSKQIELKLRKGN